MATAERSDLFARRDDVPEPGDCYFYHTMEIPGHGLVEGEWDLRGGVESYLGHEPLAGRRVLEVGTASGFLCFEMERRGADVIAYDLSVETPWDIVPFRNIDVSAVASQRADHIRRVNNSWWLAHRAFESNASVVYGSIYDIPVAIGPVDVCTLGSVLLHVRDPLAALQSVARIDPGVIIVTDLQLPRRFGLLPRRTLSPQFLPNGSTCEPVETWWMFTPEAISNLLTIVGYTTIRVVKHAQPYRGRRKRLFTVVAKR